MLEDSFKTFAVMMSKDQPLTTIVNGVRYFVHPRIVGQLATNAVPRSRLQESCITPAAIIPAEAATSQQAVRELLEQFRLNDDVYQDAFGDQLILQVTSASENNTSCGSNDVLTLEVLQDMLSVSYVPTNAALPPGPYFLIGSHIYQAWRLYPADNNASAVIFQRDEVDGTFTCWSLDFTNKGNESRQIAVPSRLYHRKTVSKPLAGVRVVLDQKFAVAGIKMDFKASDENHISLTPRTHSDFVKKLVAHGAIIVGITASIVSMDHRKAFENEEQSFTGDRFQLSDVFSPVDGAGVAKSIASYPWLDVAFDVDTTGDPNSMGWSHDAFALQSSWAATSMTGIFPLAFAFDTINIASSDLSKLQYISKTVLQFEDSSRFPRKILFPTDFFPKHDPATQKATENFVTILEKFLGVERTAISFAAEWDETRPKEAHGKSLREYAEDSTTSSLRYSHYHAHDKHPDHEQRTLYQEQFRRGYYEDAQIISANEQDEALALIDVLIKWFDKHIVTMGSDPLSNAIIVMPYAPLSTIPDTIFTNSGIMGTKNFARILQMPQLFVPFQSQNELSRGDRQVTAACSIVGAIGSDVMLINLVREALKSARLPTTLESANR